MANNNNETINVQTQEMQTWEHAFQDERNFAPLVDIYETTEDFVLVTNIPGVKKEDVKLKIEEGALTIFGKVHYEDSLKRKYLLNENEIGNYYRKFRISESIDESKIEARYENGQLSVKLPKHERVKPRTISIK